MLKELMDKLAHCACLDALSRSDWQTILRCLHHIPPKELGLAYQSIASHTGIPILDVKNAMQSLAQTDIEPHYQEQLYLRLESMEQEATEQILAFQEHHYFSTIDLKTLNLKRSEWLSLIHRFKQQNRSYVTAGFFIHHVSDIRQITVDELLENESLRRSQPERQSKPKQEKSPDFKRSYDYMMPDHNENSFILDETDENEPLAQQVKEAGGRCVPLVPATPEADRSYAQVKRTPGGNKARLVCTIGEHSFFKHISPLVNKVAPGRADLGGAMQEKVQHSLPRLSYEKAQVIEFSATLESMRRREGVPRGRSQNAIKNASASDVFRAHGLEIVPTQNRAHHWAHLIGYFLGGEQGYANLVPSTAAANYNTLDAIELFIKKLLIEDGIPEVFIKVEPVYGNQHRLIPDMLIYSLSWTASNKVELCKETFHINPQSYQRFTKSMRDSIAMLRQEECKPGPKKT